MDVELEAQRGSVTCPRSRSLCVAMCGSSSLSLVSFKQVDVCKKIHKGAFAQEVGVALMWTSSMGEKPARARREKRRKQV